MMLVDSGAKWLGKIPSHWELSKIGHCFKHRNQTVSDKEFQPLSVTKNGVVPQLDTAAKSDNSDGRKLIRQGDFVINQRSDRKGSAGVSPLDGSCSVIYTVLEPLKYVPRYAHHLFRSIAFQEEFYRWGTGIVDDLWSTRYSLMRQIVCPVPPLEEQKAIADFLDEELLRIDQLIESKLNLIKNLQERYNAYLCEVTTKGLDLAGDKTATAIEWAPKKPKHWAEVPFFTLGHEVSAKNRLMKENNLLSLSYGEIVQKDIETNEGLLPESFETYQIIDKGDLVFRFTDLQNDKKSLRSAYSTQRGIITSAYLAFRPKNCNPEFLAYQMRAWDLMKVFYAMGSGLRQSLKFSDVKRMPILLPPIDEQNAIVKALKAQHQVSQKLQTEVERAIELLKERRSTLISEAVTGKLKIRGTN